MIQIFEENATCHFLVGSRRFANLIISLLASRPRVLSSLCLLVLSGISFLSSLGFILFFLPIMFASSSSLEREINEYQDVSYGSGGGSSESGEDITSNSSDSSSPDENSLKWT